jgi:hypothetical protein
MYLRMRHCGAEKIIILFTTQFIKYGKPNWGEKNTLLSCGSAEVVSNYIKHHGGVRMPHVLSYICTYIYKIQLLAVGVKRAETCNKNDMI